MLPCRGRGANGLGEAVSVHPDSAVGALHVAGLERRFADEEGVEDHAEGPDVYLVRVACLALEDFGCDVVGCAAYRFLSFALEVDLGSEAEIAKLDFHFVAEEEVAQFQIAVDDLSLVEVLEPIEDLEGVGLDFEFSESFSSFN